MYELLKLNIHPFELVKIVKTCEVKGSAKENITCIVESTIIHQQDHFSMKVYNISLYTNHLFI